MVRQNARPQRRTFEFPPSAPNDPHHIANTRFARSTDDEFLRIELQHQAQREQIDTARTALLTELDRAARNVEANEHASKTQTQPPTVFMVSVQASFVRGPPLPAGVPLGDREGFIKSAYKLDAPVVPKDLVGRTVRVHKEYFRPDIGYSINKDCIGVIQSRIDKDIVCITAKDCGTFPVPLANIHVGIDQCAASVAPMKGRSGKVLRRWDNLQGDHCTIIRTTKDGLTAEVSFVNSSSRQNETKQVPGNAISVCAPPDAADGRGRKVRMKNPDHSKIPVGAMGYVTRLTANGTLAEVANTEGAVTHGPASDWEYGAFRNSFRFKLPTRKPIMLKPDWAHLTGKTSSTDDIKRHAYQLLMDLYADRSQVEGFSSVHSEMLNTPAKVQELAQCMQDGIEMVSPELLKVFKKEGFTMPEVVENSLEVSTNGVQNRKNDTPGVYLRGYRDFKSSRRRRWNPCYYVGMTKNMNKRDQDHTNAAYDVTKENLHYSTARDAKDRVCVQMFQLPDRYRKYTKQKQRRVLEIVETCFMLLLHTTVYDMATWEPTVDGTSSADRIADDAAASPGYIQSRYVRLLATSAVSQIAAKSAKISKWSATRAKLGMHDGLNQAMPVTTTGLTHDMNVNEKMIWTVASETLPASPDGIRRSMCVYRRGATRMRNIGLTAVEFLRMTETRPNTGPGPPGTYDLRLQADFDQLKQNGPNPNTLVNFDMEVYDPGSGHHPSPYLRTFGACPASNIDDMLSVGIKLYWEEDGVWYWRYVTAPLSAMDTQQTGAPPGVSMAYANLTALLARLRNQRLRDGNGNALRWGNIPDYASARVMETHFNDFEQLIEVRFRTTSPTELRINSSVGRASNAMQAVGLKNIGGSLKDLDTTGLTAPFRQMYHDRSDCDRCFLRKELSVVPGVTPPLCSRSGNVCQPCKQRGLPCSWTPTEQLLQGLEQYPDRNARPAHDDLPQHQKTIFSALFWQVSRYIARFTRKMISKSRFASVFLEDFDEEDVVDSDDEDD